MDSSGPVGLYPVHAPSTSILIQEDQPRIRGGLLSPCQHGRQVHCPVALALEVSGVGTTRPSTLPSHPLVHGLLLPQGRPFETSARTKFLSIRGLCLNPFHVLGGRRPFPGKKGCGNRFPVGPNEAPVGSGRLPVGPHARGLMMNAPGSCIPAPLKMSYSAFRTQVVP